MDPELGHCRLGGFVAVLILVRFAGLIRFVGRALLGLIVGGRRIGLSETRPRAEQYG